jgi:hypothetical protein
MLRPISELRNVHGARAPDALDERAQAIPRATLRRDVARSRFRGAVADFIRKCNLNN